MTGTLSSGGFGAKLGGGTYDGGFAGVIFVTVMTAASTVFVANTHVAEAQALTKHGGGGVIKPSPVTVPFTNEVTVVKTVAVGGGPLRVMQPLLTGVVVSEKEGEPEGDGEGLLDPAVLDTVVLEGDEKETGVDRAVLDFFGVRLFSGIRLGEEAGVELIEELDRETGEGLLD